MATTVSGGIPKPTVNGVGVTVIAAGVVLAWSGLANATVADTLRALLLGQEINSRPSDIALQGTQALGPSVTVPGTAVGASVAATASKYIGAPYRLGGHGPTDFDCSGLVTWVLHHDHGIQLPNNTHTVTGQFYVWTGAKTLPRNACAAGDLVCWASHIGIAVSMDEMIHAPQPGQAVTQGRIWSVPAPVIRRPMAYTTTGE